VLVIYFSLALFVALVIFILLQGAPNAASMKLAGLLAVLLGVLVLLLALQIRKAARKDSASSTESFLPTHEQSVRFMAFVGIGALLLGVVEIFAILNPADSRYVSGVSKFLEYLMGPLGPTVIYIFIGIVVLLWVFQRLTRK
jgi:hypothetical protein